MIEALQSKIHDLLSKNTAGYSEFELLQHTESLITSVVGERQGSLGLFRHHFALMHCLYTLKERLWLEDNIVLSISPINIKMEKPKYGEATQVAEAISSSLNEFFLNWKNIDEMEGGEVDTLLSSFWQKYARYVQKEDAWKILDLPETSSEKEVANRYRKLAAEYHPDKGGDKEKFIEIRAAYESLKTTFSNK